MNTKKSSGENKTYWVESVEPLRYEKLSSNQQCDVVITGAGIAGISIAYALTMRGHKVIVVEDGYVGSGETGRTTAHLVNALDDRYYELERIYGEENSKLIAESHTAAINFIQNNVLTNHIDCDFNVVNGYLFLHPSDKPENLDKELEAGKKAGLNLQMVTEMPGIKEKGRAIEFKDQATFHPMKYIKALSDLIVSNGGKIYTETHAEKFDDKGIETSDGHRIDAKFIVVATNSPVNNKVVLHLKQSAYRTYVIGGTIKKDSVTPALWWDTGDYTVSETTPPYHYVRVHPYNDEYDLLICGGEDHPIGLADAEGKDEKSCYSKLEEWTRKRFDIHDIVYKWSGQVFEPADGLAYIGRNSFDSKNVFIVSGDSGNGMTHGSLAGLIIPDLIEGKENKWEKLYDPGRFKFFKIGMSYLKDFFSLAFDYYKHKPDHPENVAIETIKNGEGKVVEIDKQKFGAYRDENGKLHFVGAECTHLGCIIKFNNSEKTWDCPCHGSRFANDGTVINGPANKNLEYHSQ